MSAVKEHKHWLSTMTCKARPDRTRQPNPSTAHKSADDSGVSNPIWAGSVIDDDADVNYVQMRWSVPTLTYAPKAYSPAEYTSIWTGIGGWNDDARILAQAGTEQDIDCNVAECQTNYAWWELFDDNYQQEITDLPVEAGDEAFASVTKTDSYTADFEVCVNTQCIGFRETSSKPIGSTAEWILERTTVGGSTCPLPQFATEELDGYFSNDFDDTSYGGPGLGYMVDMYEGADQLTSSNVSALGSRRQLGEVGVAGEGGSAATFTFTV